MEKKKNSFGPGGSLPVMSPQQIAGEMPQVSDDIYAFGSLLYDLIVGAPLFSPDITEEKIRTQMPPLLSSVCASAAIPPELDRLVGAMLEKEPERRPRGMGAVRATLENLRTDYKPQEHPVTDGQPQSGITPVARRSQLRQASQQSPGTRSPCCRCRQIDIESQALRCSRCGGSYFTGGGFFITQVC